MIRAFLKGGIEGILLIVGEALEQCGVRAAIADGAQQGGQQIGSAEFDTGTGGGGEIGAQGGAVPLFEAQTHRAARQPTRPNPVAAR